MEEKKSQVPALERALKILDAIAGEQQLSFTDIHTRTGLPKSTAYLLVKEMQRLGLLRISPGGGFTLGLKLLELGRLAAGQIDIRAEAMPFLLQLRDRVQLTCHLGVFDGEEAYYVAKVEGKHVAIINSWEGKRLSFYSSSLGKAMLAFMDRGKRDALVAQLELRPRTPNTITDKGELLRHLELCRERGWAADDEEDVLDIRCAAAPVLDSRGEVTGAVSAVGTISQVPVERLPQLAEELIMTAERISERLGYCSR